MIKKRFFWWTMLVIAMCFMSKSIFAQETGCYVEVLSVDSNFDMDRFPFPVTPTSETTKNIESMSGAHEAIVQGSSPYRDFKML
jgi:hypothetical protein